MYVNVKKKIMNNLANMFVIYLLLSYDNKDMLYLKIVFFLGGYRLNMCTDWSMEVELPIFLENCGRPTYGPTYKRTD